MRLTWRKQPYDSDRASVWQGRRGAILKVDGEDVGWVRTVGRGFTHEPHLGWSWTAVSEDGRVARRYSPAKPIESIDDAKAACESYVRSCLGGST